MTISNIIVVGLIVSMFLLFMIVLGGVAWWSERPARSTRMEAEPLRSNPQAAGSPKIWPAGL